MNELKEVKIVDKPWGRELWFALVSGKYMGKVLEIDVNEQVSLHKHMKKEETMYIFCGRIEVYSIGANGTIVLDGELKAGDVLHLNPETTHSMRCISGIKTILFEVSTPHPEDSVRIKDFYNRPSCDTYEHPDTIADNVEVKK